LTGARFSQTLLQWPNEHVVFAHLYSHPELRKGILEKEPRVRSCVAAQDLDTYKWDVQSGRQSGIEASPSGMGSHHYWSGSVAPIAFAWSEPTVHVLDPFSREIETHWRFTPPQLCLKNKADLGLSPHPVAVQPWRCSAAVVMGQIDQAMWVIQTDTAKAYAFEGIEADMWRALVAYGSTDASLAHIESRQEVRDSSFRVQLESFVDYLVGEGLIEPA
jgi:hypothetical protein